MSPVALEELRHCALLGAHTLPSVVYIAHLSGSQPLGKLLFICSLNWLNNSQIFH